MGKWSQLAGSRFLEWLAPLSGGRWLDVGCGNGAFTELVIDRCQPASVQGVDPSEAQLAFARSRVASPVAEFHQADASALPFADRTFDVAVMPLVIFFVPDPARGVAEMVRVVSRGGAIGAYAWDMQGGGSPYYPLQVEMRALGLPVPEPPSPEASRADVLRELWTEARLGDIDICEIAVERTFADLDDYWTTIQAAPSVGRTLRALTTNDARRLKERMRERLPADDTGRIICAARANAVKGQVPAR